MLWKEKIVSVENLLLKMKHWKTLGGKVVFTNGCFDVLHRGHVELLAECSTLGDYVIVGLNSDASVKKLKGETRPVHDEHSRALVLAALQWVDAIVIFDTTTPEELIKILQPDILVKGGDYIISQIAGADFVISNGGQVHIVPLVEGFSTTGILEKK